MIKWFLSLFNPCKHKYILKGIIRATFTTSSNREIDVPVYLYQCQKCDKRKVVRENDFFYTSSLLKQLDMWEKNHIDFPISELDCAYDSDRGKLERMYGNS